MCPMLCPTTNVSLSCGSSTPSTKVQKPTKKPFRRKSKHCLWRLSQIIPHYFISFYIQATQSQRSRSLPQNFDHHQLGHYNEFLQLCQHVECMVEKSMQRLTQEGKNDDDGGGVTSVAKDTKKLVDDDDMMLRSLRDANRSPAPLMKQMVHQQTNKNHYVWKEAEDRPPTKYKSQFFPMRNHDLVRDDLAVRRLIKPTGLSSTPALDRRPPPHPNHKSSSQQRPPRPKVARLKQ